MKAFLLAAGHGERLRPLTDRMPKCLVPIRGVPLLDIWLEMCCQHGLTEVLINTHAHPQVVRDYLENRKSAPKIRLSHEDLLLGSAGTLLANREWIDTDDNFWIFYGDVLTNINLTSMLEFHRQRGQLATIGVYKVSNPKQCGIVAIDHECTVQAFEEKPANPSGNLAFAGILIANRSIFDFVPNMLPADIGFHLLPRLVGRMAAYPISEYLVDIGTPAKYQQAQITWPGLSMAA